jgi:hypothetical protein
LETSIKHKKIPISRATETMGKTVINFEKFIAVIVQIVVYWVVTQYETLKMEAYLPTRVHCFTDQKTPIYSGQVHKSIYT